MKNTGFALLAILSSVLAAIVTLVACSPTSDSSSSTSAPSSSLTGTWERSCYAANVSDSEYGWNDLVRIYGKQEVIVTGDTFKSTTTGYLDTNCENDIGNVVVSGKYMLGDNVEVYPVKEAEIFDLAKVQATRAGLYQMKIIITPTDERSVQYLDEMTVNTEGLVLIQDYKNSALKEPLAALCGYEVWGMYKPTDVTSCHEFSSDNYRHTTDQKAFAVFQVSGNQLLFEVKNDAYPTYFGLNSFTRN